MVGKARLARGAHPLVNALEGRTLLTIGLPHDGVLDITFLGDRYTDMARFHADVDRAASALLSYEPFRSRADQIRIHKVDNTQSLGSSHAGTIERLLSVNEATALSIVEASGTPTDVVGVLVNDPEYGGSGGAVAVSYNGDQLGQCFAHEFCHTFGKLYDEYSYGIDGALDGRVHGLDVSTQEGNVFAGTPPAAAWSALVAPDEYFPGGGYNNWYRSSLTSLMSTVTDTLNPVSMLQIESKIDYWAGPSADRQTPQVAVAGLRDGDAVSGVVQVAVSGSDDRSVIFTQLWVDGALARNSWQAPHTLTWTTGHAAVGMHTLVVKAFDASGNVGVSAPVRVNLTGGADMQIVSPANGAEVAGGLLPMRLALWAGGASQLTVLVDGTPVPYSYPATLNDGFMVFLPGALGAGSHTLTAIASVPTTANHGQLLERYRASITIVSAAAAFGVALHSPGDGATVKGTVPLSIDVTSGNPASVRYYVDGTLIGTSTTAPFLTPWNTKKLKDGVHTVLAIAQDATGVTARDQHTVLVRNVVDRKAPRVKITTPRANAKYSTGSLLVAGRATDNVAVAMVALFLDGNQVAATSSPQLSWSCGVDALSKGKHKLRVRATDISGNVGWSTTVVIRRL